MGATTVSAQEELRLERELANPSPDEGIELVPDNGSFAGMWCAMRLGNLGLSPDDGDFWTSKADELKGLQWNLIDWDFIRTQLAVVASELEKGPSDEPEIILPGKTARERIFLERWFGYGAPCCSAQLKGSRAKVTNGAHRIRAWANYPFTDRDASALGLPQAAFTEGSSLPPDTMVPVLVY